MAEVRVHAAFTVKDEELFLLEAKKMIAATQVNKISRWIRELLSIVFFRKRKVVSSTNSLKRREKK